MSTSPSWFDQEKFSRLVKKVGPKTPPGQSGGSQALPKALSSSPTSTGPMRSEPEAKKLDSGFLIKPGTEPSKPLPAARQPEPAPKQPEPKPVEPTPPPVAPAAPAPEPPPPVATKPEPEPVPIETNPEPAPGTPPPLPEPVAVKSALKLQHITAPIVTKTGGVKLTSEPAEEATPQKMMTSQRLSLGKNAPIAPPSILVPDPAPALERAKSETSQISLVSKAPTSVPEPPALPTLPRRTSPLPELKSVFTYEIPASQPSSLKGAPPVRVLPPPLPSEELKAEAPPAVPEKKSGPLEPHEISRSAEVHTQASDDLASAWEKITHLNDDVASINHELKQALNENALLREQLKQADEEFKEMENAKGVPADQSEALLRTMRERDEAVAKHTATMAERDEAMTARDEAVAERDALHEKSSQTAETSVSPEELALVTDERDRMRSDYMELREQFEALKQTQIQIRGEMGEGRAESEKQLEEMRGQLAEAQQKHEDLVPQLEVTRRLQEVTQRELDDVHPQLEEARKQQDDAKRQLLEMHPQLEEARKQHDEAKRQADELRPQLEDVRKQHDDTKRQLDELRPQLEDIRKQHDDAHQQLEEARRQRDESQPQMEAVRKQQDEIQRQLDENRHKVEEKTRQLDESHNEVERLRKQLADKEQEITAAKSAPSSSPNDEAVAKLQQEMNELKEQTQKAKGEASTAQRGLMLSQKALQETREALREATEGGSSNKGALDNLKKENSTLVQQNMLLQAQHDQVARELSATKAKLASKS